MKIKFIVMMQQSILLLLFILSCKNHTLKKLKKDEIIQNYNEASNRLIITEKKILKSTFEKNKKKKFTNDNLYDKVYFNNDVKFEKKPSKLYIELQKLKGADKNYVKKINNNKLSGDYLKQKKNSIKTYSYQNFESGRTNIPLFLLGLIIMVVITIVVTIVLNILFNPIFGVLF